MIQETVERFWSHVLFDDECWLWAGPVANDGYGKMNAQRKQWRAHRLSWTITRGPLNDTVSVLHRCDTPLCVRPAHLFLGTNADNVRDMVDKGRQARGERLATAKLTAEMVSELRRLYAAGTYNQHQLAAIYGVTQTAVWFALQRKTWRNVP